MVSHPPAGGERDDEAVHGVERRGEQPDATIEQRGANQTGQQDRRGRQRDGRQPHRDGVDAERPHAGRHRPQRQRRLVQPDVVLRPVGEVVVDRRLAVERRRQRVGQQVFGDERVELLVPAMQRPLPAGIEPQQPAGEHDERERRAGARGVHDPGGRDKNQRDQRDDEADRIIGQQRYRSRFQRNLAMLQPASGGEWCLSHRMEPSPQTLHRVRAPPASIVRADRRGRARGQPDLGYAPRRNSRQSGTRRGLHVKRG